MDPAQQDLLIRYLRAIMAKLGRIEKTLKAAGLPTPTAKNNKRPTQKHSPLFEPNTKAPTTPAPTQNPNSTNWRTPCPTPTPSAPLQTPSTN